MSPVTDLFPLDIFLIVIGMCRVIDIILVVLFVVGSIPLVDYDDSFVTDSIPLVIVGAPVVVVGNSAVTVGDLAVIVGDLVDVQ